MWQISYTCGHVVWGLAKLRGVFYKSLININVCIYIKTFLGMQNYVPRKIIYKWCSFAATTQQPLFLVKILSPIPFLLPPILCILCKLLITYYKTGRGGLQKLSTCVITYYVYNDVLGAWGFGCKLGSYVFTRISCHICSRSKGARSKINTELAQLRASLGVWIHIYYIPRAFREPSIAQSTQNAQADGLIGWSHSSWIIIRKFVY